MAPAGAPATRRAPTRGGKAPRGFTLGEIMLVIAISGLLAAMAVPNFTAAIRKQRARSQIERYTQMIRLARNQARTTLCDIDVTVDGSNGTITVGPEATTGDCASLSTLQQSVDTKLVEISTPTVSGAPQTPFQFERRGGTEYDEYGAFAITNKITGKTTTVKVWPAIGTVEME